MLDSQKYNTKNKNENRSWKLKKYIYQICFKVVGFILDS